MRYRLTAAAFSASILFSAVLLLTDAELWTVAPSHAYVLLGLTVVDLALLSAAVYGKRFVVTYGFLYGLGKFALYLGDILTAPEFGTTYYEFASYLFGLWAYESLLAAQLAIAVCSYLERATRLCLPRNPCDKCADALVQLHPQLFEGVL